MPILTRRAISRSDLTRPGLCAAAVGLALLAAPIWAQPAPPASNRGEGPQQAPRIAPQRSPGQAPGDPAGTDGLRPERGELAPEGAYLRSRRGRMVAGEGGALVYLFDADAEGQAEPPMILQPSIRLMEMRRLAESRKETITFSLSGQVFVYNRRNYLLPTAFTTVASESFQPPAPVAPAGGGGGTGAQPGTVAGAREQADPQGADLLNEINQRDRARFDAPRPAAAPAGAGNAAGGGVGSLLREGLTLVKRRGRVERSGGAAGGSWIFLPDTGAGNEGSIDAPLRLLPCMLLAEIERYAREGGERQVITLSGQVYTYDDRNYLIPTVYLIERDREGNLIPAQ